MEIAKVKVSAVTVEILECKPIPRGLVGGTVSVEYADPVWETLSRTVVFRGAVTRDVLNAANLVEIPWETVKTAGKKLQIGFYGTGEDGSLVVPTIWADLGDIEAAADPSADPSAEPTPEVWAQLQEMIGDPEKLDTENKESLVAAINETLANSGAGVYILADGEALEAAPEEADVVIDPAGEGVTQIVTSVNGKSEDVTLSAQDVGAIPAPGTATVGQTIAATAVDENGKPTAWKAADFPDNPGYEVLADFTTAEAVTEFQTPVMDAKTAEKFRTAAEVFLWVSVPRDTSDTESTGYGTVTVSVRGSWLWAWLSNIAIIPNPTETWTKDGFIFAKASLPPYNHASLPTPAMGGYHQYSWGVTSRVNYGGYVTSNATVTNDFLNMRADKSYFKLAGSRSMPAGTRLVAGVIR